MSNVRVRRATVDGLAAAGHVRVMRWHARVACTQSGRDHRPRMVSSCRSSAHFPSAAAADEDANAISAAVVPCTNQQRWQT